LREVADHIDWTPFFQTWELAGRYPAILNDNVVGKAANDLFVDAQNMLSRIIDENWLEAAAVVGLFPAQRVGDDVEIFVDTDQATPSHRLHFLRQQMVKPSDRFNQCLADYIAPEGSGVQDFMGAFAVTAGLGIDDRVAAYERANDDYNSIMLKALADRLAEAMAELMHLKIRTEWWGYAPQENLGIEELISEGYQGIRPAPGYPACPDHSEKTTLFDLLGVESRFGMKLTDSFAMLPAASVSGFYFSHPDAHYFAVAKVDRDQVADYADRKGVSITDAERWLAPNLNY